MCSTARRRFVTDRVRSRRRGPRLVLGLRPAYRGFGIRETESIDVHLLLRLRESPWTGYGPTSSRRRWAFALALPRADRERRRSSIPMGGHKIGARGCAGRPRVHHDDRLLRRPGGRPRGSKVRARRPQEVGSPMDGRRQPVFEIFSSGRIAGLSAMLLRSSRNLLRAARPQNSCETSVEIPVTQLCEPRA